MRPTIRRCALLLAVAMLLVVPVALLRYHHRPSGIDGTDGGGGDGTPKVHEDGRSVRFPWEAPQPRQVGARGEHAAPPSAVVRKLVIGRSSDGNACDIVHLAAVSVGYAQSAQLRIMLKSILLHRSLPIHLHIITDARTLPVLDVMLATWSLPAFNYTLYPGDRHLSSISWVETTHYSGQFPLLKLLLPTLLSSVEHVIALDTDLIFLTDVAALWHIFAMFEAEEAVGVVENLSDWYIPHRLVARPWPAPEPRGVNTGVMLLHLKRLRERNWANVWRDTARAVLSDPDLGITKTSLADQDIVNAVLRARPQWMLLLSCVWNFQLSEHSLAGTQCSARDALVVHWNTRAKTSHRTALPDSRDERGSDESSALHMFHNAYEMARRLDGTSVTSATLHHACDSHPHIHARALAARSFGPPSPPPSPSSPQPFVMEGGGTVSGVFGIANVPKGVEAACPANYMAALRSTLSVHPYFVAYDDSVEATSDVTLVTHFTTDRLQAFVGLAETWQGPISAAMFVSEHDAFTALPSLPFTHVALHVVYRDVTRDDGLYPINRLRNIAVSFVHTPWYFHVDVDFSLRPDLHAVLSHHTRAVALGELDIEALRGAARGTALVVPAFEAVSYTRHVPESKEALLWELSTGQMQPFRVAEWPQGHSATDFKRWSTAEVPYLVEHETGFEPYLVLPKTAPLFDASFLGFGWNKVSHVEEVAAARFNFFVLPDVYMVHTPHHASRDLHAFRSNSRYRHCLRAVFAAARTRMARTYTAQGDSEAKHHHHQH